MGMGECMLKRTGSLGSCKLLQQAGLQHLGNQDNNGKIETPSRESISSLPWALLCLTSSGSSLLTSHTFRWANGKWACINTQYCTLRGLRGRADDSAQGTTNPPHHTLTRNTTLKWFSDTNSFLFIMQMTGTTALECLVYTKSIPAKSSL